VHGQDHGQGQDTACLNGIGLLLQVLQGLAALRKHPLDLRSLNGTIPLLEQLLGEELRDLVLDALALNDPGHVDQGHHIHLGEVVAGPNVALSS